MVAVIKTGSSIHRIFNYNENKVREGVAQCIGAVNYPKDLAHLTHSNRLNRLLKQAELNDDLKRNSVHISLNFHASESQFEAEKLLAIAGNYMERIGFGKQPFLVYQHHDAAHPHIHIVSIKVRADGSRIDMNNIGRNQSETARKFIEKKFDLVRAEEQKKQTYKLEAIRVQRVQYGKSESKRAIQNVLDHVVGTYNYTSLPELNAVLNQYNVLAERGSENSRVFQQKGLLYRVLDTEGKPVGVPIKASAFYSKPTLKFLEAKFNENEVKGMPHKARVKNAIDLALLKKQPLSVWALVRDLEKVGINTVLRQNTDGLVYGITYVDHRTRCVFNGSALGKQYSAKAIQERCQQRASIGQKSILQLPEKQHYIEHQNNGQTNIKPLVNRPKESAGKAIQKPNIEKALDTLMQPENVLDYLPYHLKKSKKKKKKRNRFSNNQ